MSVWLSRNGFWVAGLAAVFTFSLFSAGILFASVGSYSVGVKCSWPWTVVDDVSYGYYDGEIYVLGYSHASPDKLLKITSFSEEDLPSGDDDCRTGEDVAHRGWNYGLSGGGWMSDTQIVGISEEDGYLFISLVGDSSRSRRLLRVNPDGTSNAYGVFILRSDSIGAVAPSAHCSFSNNDSYVYSSDSRTFFAADWDSDLMYEARGSPIPIPVIDTFTRMSCVEHNDRKYLFLYGEGSDRVFVYSVDGVRQTSLEFSVERPALVSGSKVYRFTSGSHPLIVDFADFEFPNLTSQTATAEAQQTAFADLTSTAFAEAEAEVRAGEAEDFALYKGTIDLSTSSREVDLEFSYDEDSSCIPTVYQVNVGIYLQGWTQTDIEVGARIFTLENLVDGTTYIIRYRIYSANCDAWSDWSDTETFTSSRFGAPLDPDDGDPPADATDVQLTATAQARATATVEAVRATATAVAGSVPPELDRVYASRVGVSGNDVTVQWHPVGNSPSEYSLLATSSDVLSSRSYGLSDLGEDGAGYFGWVFDDLITEDGVRVKGLGSGPSFPQYWVGPSQDYPVLGLVGGRRDRAFSVYVAGDASALGTWSNVPAVRFRFEFDGEPHAFTFDLHDAVYVVVDNVAEEVTSAWFDSFDYESSLARNVAFDEITRFTWDIPSVPVYSEDEESGVFDFLRAIRYQTKGRSLVVHQPFGELWSYQVSSIFSDGGESAYSSAYTLRTDSLTPTPVLSDEVVTPVAPVPASEAGPGTGYRVIDEDFVIKDLAFLLYGTLDLLGVEFGFCLFNAVVIALGLVLAAVTGGAVGRAVKSRDELFGKAQSLAPIYASWVVGNTFWVWWCSSVASVNIVVMMAPGLAFGISGITLLVLKYR